MNTKSSPLPKLRTEANRIASYLKNGSDLRMSKARVKPSFKAGIVMDDKTIILEMPWTLVDSTSETALAELILKQMREQKDDA